MKARAAKLTAGGIAATAIAGSLLILSGGDDPALRFSGGAFDGSANTAFLQNPPEPYVPSARFSGSTYDGAASAAFLQNPEPVYVPSARFSGNSYDGSDECILLQNADVPYQPPARYSGGSFDGYAEVVYFGSSGYIDPSGARFHGGGFDGYADILLVGGGSFSPEHQIFSGGAFDGSASVSFLTGSHISPGNSPRFSGGFLDGHAVVFQSCPVFDWDNDGLPDHWELRYTVRRSVLSSTSDFDNDGFSAKEEYIAGTKPLDSGSRFNVYLIPIELGDGWYFITEWNAVTGRVYNVSWAPTLFDPFELLETNIEHPQNSHTDTNHVAGPKGFYKVEVRLK